MFTLVSLELYKIFAKTRSLIAFGAVLFIVVVIQFALAVDGKNYLEFATASIQENFMFEGNIINGYLSTYIILNALLIHVPLLIALVCGDLISGEASSGTIRFLLTRRVSRSKIVFSKFAAALIYSTLLVVFLAILSIGLGVLFLGKGDMFILKDIIYVIEENDVLWRFALAFLFSVLGMATVSALAFMFSVFSNSSITPIIMTMVVIIVFTILSAIDLSLFKLLKKFFFTTYMNNWKLFFEEPLNYFKIERSILVLVVHIVVFYFISLWQFKRKDILG